MMNKNTTRTQETASDAALISDQRGSGSSVPVSVGSGFLRMKEIQAERREMKKKVCKMCDKKFLPRNGRQIYCGQEFEEGTCAYENRLETMRRYYLKKSWKKS